MFQDKRRLLIFLLVVIVAITSCTKPTGEEQSQQQSSPEEPATEQTPQAIEKVTFTTGEVTVTLPESWTATGANETMDGYIQEDASLSSIYLVKNMESEMDVFRNPGIQINYYNKDTQMRGVGKDFYENTADLDPLELDNYTWTGYTGESMGAPLAILFANYEKGEEDQFQVAVWFDMGGDDKITLEDDDVLEILSSIQPAK